MINIDLAKDFHEFPFGMYYSDGKWSGERFRNEYLLKNLIESNDKINIHLNTKCGLGSSFIIGAFSLIVNEKNPSSKKYFGGISRNFTVEDIRSRVSFTTDLEDNELIDEIAEIFEYMEEIEVKTKLGLAKKMLSNFNLENEINSFKINIEENINILSKNSFDKDLVILLNSNFDNILEDKTFSKVHSTVINLVDKIKFRLSFMDSKNNSLYRLLSKYIEDLFTIKERYICFQH